MPRIAEPWLTGFDVWQRCYPLDEPGVSVQKIRCEVTNIPAIFVSLEPGSCDAMMQSHTRAVEILAYAPACTDAAIEKLSEFAAENSNAQLFSDLAGAHLVRARRDDRPSDYVHALWAAEQALKRDPRLSPARFNAALAEEGIGFWDEALSRWTALSREAPEGWRDEAAAHVQKLRERRTREHAMECRLNIERLSDVLRDPDPNALEELISPCRYSAQAYAEDEILRDWATISAENQTAQANETLAMAQRIAAVLEKLNKDSYLADSVRKVRSARDPRVIAALREGHLKLAIARLRFRALDRENLEPLFTEAQQALARAGSPLRHSATIGRIAVLTRRGQNAEALAMLRTLERDARRDAYLPLLARVHSARAHLLGTQGSYFQSLAEYTKAQDIHHRTSDTENVGSVQSRRLGVLVEIGNIEETWRHVMLTQRYPSLDFNSRHLLFGETARLSVEMNHAAIGLRFQDRAVRLLENGLRQSRNERLTQQLLGHLGIALRARASIRARLDDREGARADLAQAMPLIGDKRGNLKDALIPIGFTARLAEAQAQTIAKSDRKSAIALLSRGIRELQETHYKTFMASLLLQRAELHRLDRNRPAALSDLQTAAAALREEAKGVLEGTPDLTPPDRLWNAYFSRRQDAYRRLVRMLIEEANDPRSAEAFNHVEESRAHEPLHAMQQRNVVPAELTGRLSGGSHLPLRALEDVIPAGTFLLRYYVLDDLTYLWIVRNGHSERETIRVRNDEIAKWSASLQHAARDRADEKFRQLLTKPFDALLRGPLAHIARLHGNAAPPRVVIVPDRAMHGLPFAALSDGNRYMVEDYRISVAASATLYALSVMRDRELARLPFDSGLFLGQPAFDKSETLARGLPREAPGLRVDRIQRIYEPLARVEPLVGRNATRPRFLDFSGRGSIIHLAAHGVANPNVPSRSFFLLAPAEEDAGVLDAERLSRELQPLTTRLAVLAACSSAGGAAVGPEGLAPFVRPFAIAGVPGVIGTLWNVSAHQETEELLVRLHLHYSKGLDADDALRRAQLEMLRDPVASRNTPRAWAAFQMIGHASSPFSSQ